MRAVLIRSLLVIGAGALVLAGVLYVASTVDARPPEVLEVALTQPVAGDPERAQITTSIEISFSEPIDPDGVREAIVIEPPVEGSESWSGSTLLFTPSQPLELETEYRLTVAPGIRDLAGNEMEAGPDPFVFVTTGRPTLVSTDPADGAGDVPVDATIELVFSGLMDTPSVEAALEVEPRFDHQLRWSGERLEIIPTEPLEPATDYLVRLRAAAADVAGVELAREVIVAFRTVAPGLRVERIIPADGTVGISPRTPIAIVFDRAVDPGSVESGTVVVAPDVAGTVELVGTADDPETRRVVRFSPSGPLPANTTIDVRLEAVLAGTDGGILAEPVSWTFTTGAPQATLSNQVLFLSDRAGVTNVWAMNPDGTGQRQVSSELEPILDYAAAPTGSGLVVSDGRRLIHLRADGSERRVLTDAAHLEFDPAWAPDGSRVAFARADATSGAGLGLWSWEIGAGSATRIDVHDASGGGSPTQGGDDAEAEAPLRAPRYSPDGGALVYVDARGAIGILELPMLRRTVVEAVVAGAPAWDARSSTILFPLGDEAAADAPRVRAPVRPLEPDDGATAGLVRRSGTTLGDPPFDGDVRRVVIGPNGRVAWIDADGGIHLADGPTATPGVPEALAGTRATDLAFGPAEEVVLVVREMAGGESVVERIDLESGERTQLIRDGHRVRWLP